MSDLPGLADHADRQLGDGKAQAWEFLFVARGEYFLVVIGSEGDVIRQGTASMTPEAVAGTGALEWNLDSDEVVQVVRRHVADWEAVSRDARIVHWYLVRPTGYDVAQWLVGFEGAAGTRSYLVNSMNGSFLPFDLDHLPDVGVPAWEGARQSVILSPQQQTLVWPFVVKGARHPALVVGLRVERTTTGTVNLTLRHDGLAIAWADWAANLPPGVRKAEAAWPANGTYELTARLTSLTPQAVEVFWCAKGVPVAASTQHACSL
jgi:hypothetical protein